MRVGKLRAPGDRSLAGYSAKTKLVRVGASLFAAAFRCRARKAISMVASSPPQLGVTPRPLDAQQMLRESLDCLDRSDTIGAGVRIRQAAKLILTAWAESCGVRRPLRHRYPRPARIARALHRAGRIDEKTLKSLLGIIDACNASAHGHTVCASCLLRRRSAQCLP